MSDHDAYLSGAAGALRAFGIRTAADHLTRRMPDGPPHLGAEWLSKRLRQEVEEHTLVPGSRASYRKLERSPQWGNPTSLEASGSNAQNYAGMSHYGGV